MQFQGWTSVLGALEEHARLRGSHPALIVLDQHAGIAQAVTYRELYDRSLSIAASLQACFSVGSRIALVLPTGVDFVASFLGALSAGLVAVPASIPRSRMAYGGLASMLEDCAASAVITSEALRVEIEPEIVREHPSLRAVRWLVATDLRGSGALQRCEVEETLAFLQYTSGSTAKPRGVMLSHANLTSNMGMIKEAFGHSCDTAFVSWLPLFHDQGLIGSVLQPLWLGTRAVLMSPTTFLKRPWLWLRAISDHKAFTSGGPNFGYDQVLRSITAERLANLDLRSWRVAFNGAEPVRAETLEACVHALAPYGFRSDAWTPCYGLAEATLLVSGGPVQFDTSWIEIDRNALEVGEIALRSGGERIVSCGKSRGGLEIAVIDPAARRAVPPYRVGEIWLRGASVAGGYYANPTATEDTFGAERSDAHGRYLRTGDLGFLDGRGELYLTGRLKDILIIEGKNHYPQDVESTVERCDPLFQRGMTAVFGLEDAGTCQLVVLQEVMHATDLVALGRKVRRALREVHGLATREVVFVRRGDVPRTTSGKVRRGEAKRRYVESTYHVVERA